MKKKILFVLEAFDKGGIEKVTLDIVNNLDPNQYDITVKTIWYGGYCQSKVKPHIKVEPFFKTYFKGVMRLFIYLPKSLLYRLYIHDWYDIEIAAGDGIPSRIISGSSNKKSKKVSWIHMDVLELGSQLKELKSKRKSNKFYDSFDLIACVSKGCKENFEKKFGFETKTLCVNNPINNNEIIRLSNEETEFEFDSNYLNIISVGRLEDEKGFDRLINVVKKILDNNIKIKLYIIGEGSKRLFLKNKIEKENLKEYVKLLGFKANPYKYIKKADIYVLSSRTEAYPTVLIEACILGIPIIATKCCGVNEILNYGYYGCIVENNEQSLYNGLYKIINDKQILIRYKKKSRNRGIDFNFERLLKDFESKVLN